jgi:hypothetical protein
MEQQRKQSYLHLLESEYLHLLSGAEYPQHHVSIDLWRHWADVMIFNRLDRKRISDSAASMNLDWPRKRKHECFSDYIRTGITGLCTQKILSKQETGVLVLCTAGAVQKFHQRNGNSNYLRYKEILEDDFFSFLLKLSFPQKKICEALWEYWMEKLRSRKMCGEDFAETARNLKFHRFCSADSKEIECFLNADIRDICSKNKGNMKTRSLVLLLVRCALDIKDTADESECRADEDAILHEVFGSFLKCE